MEDYFVPLLAKEKGSTKAMQIIVENLQSTELSFVMLFHEMSIPHKARYQLYIKFLELAYVHGPSIMVES